MSSWRSSNVDEMVRAAFAEERLPPPPKEGERRRVSSVVDLAMVRCGLPSAGGAPRSGAVVGIVADDDGVVPGCPGGGSIVEVAADHDGAVPGRPRVGTIVADVVLDVADGGAFEDPEER